MAKKNLFKAQYGLTEKEAWSYILRLREASYTSVYDVYDRPSSTKVAIENRIKRDGLEKGMREYRVISANTFHFSCGYFFDVDGAVMVRIETPSYTYEFPYGEVRRKFRLTR